MQKGEPFKDPPPHGTHARYVSRYYSCRTREECPGGEKGLTCVDANREYMRDYRRRVSNNGGEKLREKLATTKQGSIIQKRRSQ